MSGLLSVSMFNSLADWMNPFYLGYVYNQKIPKRNGMTHPIIVPYGAYNCKDNLTLLIAIQNDREWSNLCKIVLCDETMAADKRFKMNADRVANRDLTEKIIQEKFLEFDLPTIFLSPARPSSRSNITLSAPEPSALGNLSILSVGKNKILLKTISYYSKVI